jgi:hypothetical protein
MTLRIIFGALLSSLALYAGLTFIIKPPPGFAPDPSTANLPFIFAIPALGMLPAIAVLRQILFWRPLKDGAIPADQLMDRFRVVSITSWAMCESIAVFGLAIHMISFNQPAALAFIAASSLAMISLAPIKLPRPNPSAGSQW